MTRPRTSLVLLAAAALQLQSLAAAAQPAATLNGPAGAWLGSLRGAALATVLAAGPAPEGAPRQDDAVLGVFRTATEQGTEFWAWRQGDASLGSAKLRESLKDPKAMGVRPLNALLEGSGAGSWLVARRPLPRPDGGTDQKPIFLFTDKDSGVFFAEIAEEKVYGEGQERVRLPLALARSGEKLIATYGSEAAGLVELHRFTPEGGDAVLGFFEYATHPKTKKPALTGARLFADADALEALFAQPGFKDLPGVAALKGKPETVARLGSKLRGGGSLTVTVDRFGNAEFNHHKDAKDEKGTPQLYLLNGQVMEAGE